MVNCALRAYSLTVCFTESPDSFSGEENPKQCVRNEFLIEPAWYRLGRL